MDEAIPSDCSDGFLSDEFVPNSQEEDSDGASDCDEHSDNKWNDENEVNDCCKHHTKKHAKTLDQPNKIHSYPRHGARGKSELQLKYNKNTSLSTKLQCCDQQAIQSFVKARGKCCGKLCLHKLADVGEQAVYELGALRKQRFALTRSMASGNRDVICHRDFFWCCCV